MGPTDHRLRDGEGEGGWGVVESKPRGFIRSRLGGRGVVSVPEPQIPTPSSPNQALPAVKGRHFYANLESEARGSKGEMQKME